MYEFFDEKIQDSTLIVALIGVVIVATGFFAHNNIDVRANILHTQTKQLTFLEQEENIVLIDGKKYQVIFQEISE